MADTEVALLVGINLFTDDSFDCVFVRCWRNHSQFSCEEGSPLLPLITSKWITTVLDLLLKLKLIKKIMEVGTYSVINIP